MDDVFVVTTTEHHYLPTCPCNKCEAERQRRGLNATPDTPIRHISVDTAYLLGFITRRCPSGSLARQEMLREQQGY